MAYVHGAVGGPIEEAHLDKDKTIPTIVAHHCKNIHLSKAFIPEYQRLSTHCGETLVSIWYTKE